ncbi:MAG: hypothetical protein KGY99_03015 [Phycisphaerae bacterium]|nr:hypothetical protein [Phycisphaerae bacterium]
MRKFVLSVLIVLATAGCNRSWFVRPVGPDYIAPSIAVMKFENRAALPVGWNIGEGMRDILVDRLVATERFHVIERPELEHVLKELRFQQTGATREQRRAELGRLKNVQYLIKGTVTDFGHVSTNTGFLGVEDKLGLFGGGNRAVVSMTLYVVEVESGEIVCSESITESVRAGEMNVKAAYKGVGFGGSTFYRTPLGRVTADVIDQCVWQIAQSVAARPWRPMIAQVVDRSTVILNGGRNREVTVGDGYDVRRCGEPIVDPDTGDVIGTSAGGIVGRIYVQEVHERYSVARIVEGRAAEFEVGQRCRPAPAREAPAPPGAATGARPGEAIRLDARPAADPGALAADAGTPR